MGRVAAHMVNEKIADYECFLSLGVRRGTGPGGGGGLTTLRLTAVV